MYLLYSTLTSGKTVPLYIHTFKLKKTPDIELADNASVSDRLKFYRTSCELLQKEAAEKIGVDRTTYARWEDEDNVMSAYPLDKLAMLAEIFGCDINDLLDEYNLFLLSGQGEAIKNLRKRLGLTQRKLAVMLSVSVKTVKGWEHERIRVSRKCYIRLMKAGR